jgi:hypothetical protein
MEVSDRPGIVPSRSQEHRYEFDSENRQFFEMPDNELLRFGATTKFRCLCLRNSRSPQLPALLAQLTAARAEWNRRHSQLPLVDSF